MKNTVKEVFESDNWIITKISQGYNKKVRIDAKRRYPVADQSSFFSEWTTEKYANSLSTVNYGKKVKEFSCYEY